VSALRQADVPAQETARNAAADMPSADRLEAAVRRLHAAALSQITEASGPASMPAAFVPALSADSETHRGAGASIPPRETDLGNVRASFIAAARRASQTATPDKPAPASLNPAELIAADGDAGEEQAPETSLSVPSLIERLRRSFDARRRPLLLGLAFLVLAAGAARILSDRQELPPSSPAPVQAASAAPAAEQPVAAIVNASASQDETSLLQPARQPSAAFTPAKFRVDPSTVGDIPAQVPGTLREAALSGDAAAIYDSASRASEGRGLAHDPILAAHLYERAAQAGFAPAQERLAMLYEKGVGLLRDTKLASTWYERAAIGGNVRAMHNLATLLASGLSGKPDYAAAFRWYAEAAEAGLQDSQFNLGVLYARGIGTRTDLPKAFKWFALAAAQGDAEAAKKRDEVAVRLNAAELAAAKTLVEHWQSRAVDPSANAGAPAAQDQTAALEPSAGGKS
jgi:localization factor PodJL